MKTYPKNIIVLAGEPNSGKTAFLLNVVGLNKDKYPIKYFSSEMGAEELRVRLEKFKLRLDWWPDVFFEWSHDFADPLDPDGINIIDFLEIHA